MLIAPQSQLGRTIRLTVALDVLEQAGAEFAIYGNEIEITAEDFEPSKVRACLRLVGLERSLAAELIARRS